MSSFKKITSYAALVEWQRAQVKHAEEQNCQSCCSFTFQKRRRIATGNVHELITLWTKYLNCTSKSWFWRGKKKKNDSELKSRKKHWKKKSYFWEEKVDFPWQKVAFVQKKKKKKLELPIKTNRMTRRRFTAPTFPTNVSVHVVLTWSSVSLGAASRLTFRTPSELARFKLRSHPARVASCGWGGGGGGGGFRGENTRRH